MLLVGTGCVRGGGWSVEEGRAGWRGGWSVCRQEGKGGGEGEGPVFTEQGTGGGEGCGLCV